MNFMFSLIVIIILLFFCKIVLISSKKGKFANIHGKILCINFSAVNPIIR